MSIYKCMALENFKWGFAREGKVMHLLCHFILTDDHTPRVTL